MDVESAVRYAVYAMYLVASLSKSVNVKADESLNSDSGSDAKAGSVSARVEATGVRVLEVGGLAGDVVVQMLQHSQR